MRSSVGNAERRSDVHLGLDRYRSGMDRVEMRELHYFRAVAEELHFGRAAARLGIAQPPLSRAVAALERRLGVELLQRTSRSVVLTSAGQALLHESGKVLDAVQAAIKRTQRAGQPEPRLPVVMKPGGDAGLLPEILAEYGRDPGAITVEILICGIAEQATWLRDGRADVAFVHHPHDDLSGFDTEPLLDERQVVVVPRIHRFAERASVTLDELSGEPLPRWPGTPATTTGPEIRDSGQLMQLITLGQAIAVLPESVTTRLGRDLVAVPVTDAPPTTMLIAWAERSHSLPVAAFVRAAALIASRHQRHAAIRVPA